MGWIQKNPARGRLKLPERRLVRLKLILSPAQVVLLASALRQPYRAVLLLAVLSGLRKGELEALRWLDWHGNALTVDEAIYRRDLGTPKRSKLRTVTIGPLAQQALEEWKAQPRFLGPDDFIFAVRTNSPIDLHNALARHVKPTCSRLGLPLISMHDLRHSHTTWGRKAGVSAETMRDQLGHASVKTTLDIYSHATDGTDAAMRIESLLMEPRVWNRSMSIDRNSLRLLDFSISAGVAQMVRAPDCGSGGPRFDPGRQYQPFRARKGFPSPPPP